MTAHEIQGHFEYWCQDRIQDKKKRWSSKTTCTAQDLRLTSTHTSHRHINTTTNNNTPNYYTSTMLFSLRHFLLLLAVSTPVAVISQEACGTATCEVGQVCHNDEQCLSRTFPCGANVCDNTPGTICVLSSATGAFPNGSCQTQGAVCTQALELKCRDTSVYMLPPVGFNETQTAAEICGNTDACDPPGDSVDPNEDMDNSDSKDDSGSCNVGMAAGWASLAAFVLA